MTKNTNVKTPEQIIEDLENISPLNMSEYIMECEFYDMQDAHEVFAEAVAEFEDKGGVAANLVEPVLAATANSVLMVGLKKYQKKTYDQVVKGKVNLGGMVNKAINFKYPENFLSAPVDTTQFADFAHDQILTKEIIAASEFDQKYKRENLEKSGDKTARNKWKEDQYKKDTGEQDTVKKDVLGKDAYITKKEAEKAGGDPGKDVVNTDHVLSLKQIHSDYGNFSVRYGVSEDRLRKIANSEENYQLMNASDNDSKDEKSAKDFAKDKNLTPEQRKALLKNERKAKEHVAKELTKDGTKTVAIEQIGKILEVLVGPISYEIRDMISNGITHGMEEDNPFKALWARICRMIKYILQELPRLLGEFLSDLGQMLTHLALSVFGMITKLFGKLIEVVSNGLSSIKEAVKILSSNQYKTSAEKADAIAKLLITLVTAVVGQFLIDMGLEALGIKDPWSEIIAALVSSILSTVIVYFFNKLDLFGVQSDVRRARIEEIFDARIEAIKKNTEQFDIAVTEKLRAQRIQFEKCRIKMTESLQQKDFLSVTETLDDAAKFFAVDIPYSTSEEFVRYVRDSSAIKIAAA